MDDRAIKDYKVTTLGEGQLFKRSTTPQTTLRALMLFDLDKY